jgi:hypothetical protein
MANDLEPLSTDPNDFVFLDVETRSTVDVTVGGAYNHTANGVVTILAYAIGDGPVKDWCVRSFEPGERLRWSDAPDDLKAALRRVRAGEAWIVAFNSSFEYLALTRGIDGDLG